MEKAVLSQNELSDAIRKELTKFFGVENLNGRQKQNMNMEDAVKYLAQNGCDIKKSTLYEHTANGTIKFSRFGKRRIVFSREQLDDFIKNMKK